MRPLFIPLLTLLALPAPLFGQPPTPVVELALQTSQETGAPTRFAISPRLTFAVGPDTAMDVGLDLTPEGADDWGTRSSGYAVHAAIRERVWARDRLEVFGSLGVSYQRLTRHVPPYEFRTSTGSVTVPGHTGYDTDWAGEVTASVQYALLPRLKLRADGRIIAGERGSLGAAVGVVTSLGRVAPPATPQDSVSNGLAVGAISGAIAGAASFGFLYWALDEGGSRPSEAFGATTVGGLLGGAVGAIIGAVVDHWIK